MIRPTNLKIMPYQTPISIDSKVTCELNGCIGNQLFQLATTHHLARKHNKTACVDTIQSPSIPHSSKNYFDSIFSKWRNTLCIKFFTIVQEVKWFEYYNYSLPENAKISGYFQHYEHIEDDFKDTLNFNTDILTKYPNIKDTVFLHIRGGDHISPSHYIDFTNYYKNAIKEFPEGTQFSVFTDDLPFDERYLKDISYSLIRENEEDSLFLMTQCSAAICANSTFSWWGAFLNRDRKIVLPSKWLNYTMDFRGIYFDGCTIVDV